MILRNDISFNLKVSNIHLKTITTTLPSHSLSIHSTSYEHTHTHRFQTLSDDVFIIFVEIHVGVGSWVA